MTTTTTTTQIGDALRGDYLQRSNFFFFWRANILHTLRMATRMLRSFADSVICGLAHYTFRYYRSSSIIGGWCFFLVVVEVVVVEGLSRWCRRSSRKNNSED